MTRPLTVTTPNATDILVVRSFNAPRALVWKAFHTPEFVSQWLLGPGDWTMPECEIDARVGGAFKYVWAHGDGRSVKMSGTYVEVSPPAKTVHVEQFDEADGVTTVTMTVSFESGEARDAARATGMTDGMEDGYARLDKLLAELG